MGSCISCHTSEVSEVFDDEIHYNDYNDVFENPAFEHILEKIFMYLDHKSLMSCKEVNQYWKRIIESKPFWLRKCYIHKLNLSYSLYGIDDTYFFENLKNSYEIEDILFVPIFYVEGAYLKFKMLGFWDEAKKDTIGKFEVLLEFQRISEDPEFFTFTNYEEPSTYKYKIHSISDENYFNIPWEYSSQNWSKVKFSLTLIHYKYQFPKIINLFCAALEKSLIF